MMKNPMATNFVSADNPTKGLIPLGPYRATKLWNEVIQAFRSQMPTSRHRRYMKSYDVSFVASDAVTWLHSYLRSNDNFGPTVTRIQTIQLLEKFHRAGLFRDVRTSKGKVEFTDNSRLYRFVCESPLKPSVRSSVRVPLSNQTGMLNTIQKDQAPASGKPPLGKEKKSVLKHAKPSKPITVGPPPPAPQKPQPNPTLTRNSPGVAEVNNLEVERLWLSHTLERLREILQLDSLGDILEPGCVHVSYLIHNLTQVNQEGLVTNISKDEQLPPWVVSAMRCLAYWPAKVDDKLPNYPGFEKDVFKVVKEYFERLSEPLTTYNLYELFVGVMAHLDNVQRPSYGSTTGTVTGRPEQPSHTVTSYASVENLMANMTLDARLRADQDLRPQEIMIVHDPEMEPSTGRRPSKSWRRSQSASNLQRTHSSASILKKETSFGVDSAQTPVYYCDDDDDEDGAYTTHYRVVNEKMVRVGSTTDSADDMYVTVQARSGSRLSRSDTTSRSAKARHRAGSLNEVYRHKITSTTPSRETLERCTSEEDNCNSYGYAPVMMSAPRRQDLRGSRGQDKYSWAGSSVSITSSASSKPCEPPPYPSPPSYHMFYPRPNSCTPGASRSHAVNLSNTSSSYHTARSSTTSLRDLNQHIPAHHLIESEQDQENEMAEPRIMMHSKSRVSLQESYRHAINPNGTPATPGRCSLYSSVRRPPSARSRGAYRTIRRDSPHSPGMIATTSRDRVLDALQLVCLFLPPSSRRKLHFLLRLISKVSTNMELQLDQRTSNRDLMLNTFTSAILRNHTGVEFDELLIRRLVSFLVDHHQVVLQAPQLLRQEIEVKIDALKTARMVMAASACTSSSCPTFALYSTTSGRAHVPTTADDLANHNLPQHMTYCEQVSLEQFEQQCLSGSHGHLATLLEDIVQDRKMASKDKKRRLKQFEKNYPDIYYMRFPENAKQEQPLPPKPKMRAPLLGRPLQKLKILRM